jgi:hypothetical protein
MQLVPNMLSSQESLVLWSPLAGDLKVNVSENTLSAANTQQGSL